MSESDPLKIGLTREPISLEKKLQDENRETDSPRREDRVKTEMGFKYTNNCGRQKSTETGGKADPTRTNIPKERSHESEIKKKVVGEPRSPPTRDSMKNTPPKRPRFKKTSLRQAITE